MGISLLDFGTSVIFLAFAKKEIAIKEIAIKEIGKKEIGKKEIAKKEIAKKEIEECGDADVQKDKVQYIDLCCFCKKKKSRTVYTVFGYNNRRFNRFKEVLYEKPDLHRARNGLETYPP